jgi:hypothetical protein
MCRSLLLITVPLLALFTPASPAGPPPVPSPPAPFPDKVHVSIHCQMDYRETVTRSGMPGYLVVALHDNPEAGRLGSIRFKVGDVILGVGHYAATPGERLDVLINLAMAEDARTIQVLDRSTGEMRVLEF